jgi:hypothetical protein
MILMTTNATDLGPLQILIGTWQGQSGTDIAPESDGTETNLYRERIIIEPVRPFSNAEEQRLFAVQYHQVVYRIKDNKQIHDQCGYYSWDEKANLVMHSFTIPRGLGIVAGGTVTIDEKNTHQFNFEATEGHSQWPITQSPFLAQKAKTLSFAQSLKVAGSELNYEQTTMVDIYGNEFEHTDKNRLIRVM